MALDPRTDVRGRMLVAILVRFAERMVQLERRGQRRESEQGKPQHREQQITSAVSRQGLHQAGDNTNPLCYSQPS